MSPRGSLAMAMDARGGLRPSRRVRRRNRPAAPRHLAFPRAVPLHQHLHPHHSTSPPFTYIAHSLDASANSLPSPRAASALGHRPRRWFALASLPSSARVLADGSRSAASSLSPSLGGGELCAVHRAHMHIHPAPCRRSRRFVMTRTQAERKQHAMPWKRNGAAYRCSQT